MPLSRPAKETGEMSADVPPSGKSVDIIGSLHERLMDDVLEQIFEEMDAATLLRAELVCSRWRRAILQSRVWSKLFERKRAEVPLWTRACNRLEEQLSWRAHDDAVDKIRYLATEGSLKRLDRNWRCGRYRKTIRYTEMFDLGHTMRLKDRHVYLVNDQGNECMCLVSHTLQLTQVIQLPGDSACSCFDTDERVAFFGCENGVVRVVDVDTGQQVHQLVDLKGSYVEQLRVGNQLLATLSSSNSHNQESYQLCLWRVCSASDVRIETRIPLLGTAVEDLYLDDRFALVVLVALEPSHPCRVYVVSTEMRRVVQTIDYEFSSGHHHWASCYLNGLMVDYHPAAVDLTDSASRSRGRRRFGKGIRVVEVATGLCLRTVAYGRGELQHLRLNAKYMVGLQVNPVLNIYDRLAAVSPIDESESKKKGLVHLVSVQLDSMVIVHYHVDDFQIVLYGWSRWNRPHSRLDYRLVVLDFFDGCPNAEGKPGAAATRHQDSPQSDSSSASGSECEFLSESGSDFDFY